MTKMPEVYEDFDALKAVIKAADRVVVYATPQTSSWLVDKEYEPKLCIGEAVKITKWVEELNVVPIRRQREAETDQWYWRELSEPFSRPIQEDDFI